MLSETECAEINHALEAFPHRHNACIDALKIVNKHRRWVSDESVKDVADYLNMSPAQVDQVATFYNLIFRKPVGQYVILLCDSVSCWIMGYEGIYQHLKDSLGIEYGQTTDDGLFTLLPIPCLGTCDHAPAMMIEDQLYRDLTPAKIDEIIQHYKQIDKENVKENTNG